MNTIAILAGKEIKDGLRNRWVAAATVLLAGLSLSLTSLGSLPTGSVGADPLAVAVVGLSSLTIYLIPLIALLLAYDAMAGEMENGTLLLLLSYPVSRWQVMVGKFLGHAAILVFATVMGYGSAGAALFFGPAAIDQGSWTAFLGMIGSSALLGAAFLSLGYLISVSVNERSTAAGVAVVAWLFFVLLYDLAILGLLTSAWGQGLGGGFVQGLLLFNPADVYRLFNLSGLENINQLSGLGGLSGQNGVAPAGLLGLMGLWTVAPLSIAVRIFSRKEL